MYVWLNLLLYLYCSVSEEGEGTLSVELGCHSTEAFFDVGR